MVGVAGDKDQLQPLVGGAEPAGGLHAVQLSHLNIQKDHIQLPCVLFQPAEQSLAGGEFEKRSLSFPPIHGPFQGGFQGNPGVGAVVTDANPKHDINSSSFAAFHSNTAIKILQTKLDRKTAKYDITAVPAAKVYTRAAKKSGPVCGGRFFALC